VGPRGLQGGTPPDFVRDMERLQRMQAGVREKTERIARELDLLGVTAWRLDESIRLMKSVEDDLRDFRYESAIPKRRIALHLLDDALTGEGEQIGVYLSRARHLPAALREELVQSADEPLPPGYGDLVKRYYRRLSEAGE